jgi:gliding motility-associated lipoprotein GldH
MSKQMHKIILVALVIILSSCNGKTTVFDQYKEFPTTGWHKDSVAHFEVTLEKGTTYNNRGDYKTQNMWLFISYERPDKSIKKDTLEIYLADNQGRWLGTGFGSLYEMPVVFIPKIKIAQTGVYKFDIKHGMRDTTLVGINDIGLEILK